MRGPQDGDWVRAIEDCRDGPTVEGVLRLRHVPVLDHVQVLVVGDAGQYHVDPASIEVVRAGIAVLGNADLGDPLQADARWRRITDLDSAIAEGLVHPARERAGGSWADLHDRLEGLVAPMLAVGWRIVGRDRDESAEFGDSVFCRLERSGLPIELELYGTQVLIAWSAGDSEIDEPDGDGEPAPALFSLYAPTIDEIRIAFVEQGWLTVE